jgi:hypothetical protein
MFFVRNLNFRPPHIHEPKDDVRNHIESKKSLDGRFKALIRRRQIETIPVDITSEKQAVCRFSRLF